MAEKKRSKRRPSLSLGHLASILQSTMGGSLEKARLGTRAIFDEILRAALEGEAISIHKFGRFEGVDRKARVGRNPRTGELLELPGSRALVFRRARNAMVRVPGAGEVKRSRKK